MDREAFMRDVADADIAQEQCSPASASGGAGASVGGHDCNGSRVTSMPDSALGAKEKPAPEPEDSKEFDADNWNSGLWEAIEQG